MKFFGLILSLYLTTPAGAVSPYFSLGFGSGGEQLNEVTGGQNYKIRAGSTSQMMLGAILPISPTVPHRFELQLGLGYSIHSGGEKGSRVEWQRFPLEAIYYYRNTQEGFRFGWGGIYHFNNEIIAKGKHRSASAHVDPAYGTVLAADYLLGPPHKPSGYALGFRYQWIKYNSPSFSRSVDGQALLGTMTFSLF